MTNEDQKKFKEEVLKKLMEIEKSINLIQPKIMETKLNDVLSKLDFYSERLNEIEKMANKDKVIIDTIHDLKTNLWNSQENLSNQEIKLNLISKELKESVKKYDRIFLDNLYLPSIIGENNCRFRSLREYIEYSLENMYSLLNSRDNTKSLLNSNSEKMENLSKSFKNQLEYLESNMKMYVKSMIEIEKNQTKIEFENLETKLSSLKLVNHKVAQELKNSANDLKMEKEEFSNLKADFHQKIEEMNINYENFNKNNLDKIETFNSEFELMKAKLSEISEYIKDNRTKKNLSELPINDLKHVPSKLTFDRGQFHYDSNGSKSIQSRENLPSVSNSLGNVSMSRKNSTKEKNEIAGKIYSITGEDEKLGENKQIVPSKFYKKTSNSNINLPKINLEEEYQKVPAIHINFTERSNNQKETHKIKRDKETKNHTFFNNITSNYKDNRLTNSLILSDHYSSQGNPVNITSFRNIEIKPSNFSKVRYVTSQRQEGSINKSSVKYSMDKLDSDFQFKHTLINFNPLKGLKQKNTKLIITPNINKQPLDNSSSKKAICANEDKKRSISNVNA